MARNVKKGYAVSAEKIIFIASIFSFRPNPIFMKAGAIFRLLMNILIFLSLTISCENSTGENFDDYQRPNVVIILADDLGYSDIGAYGSEIRTPNLDQLAQGGIRFTQMHNTGKCFPSRAVLLTGLYAQQVGMDRKPEAFRNSVMFGEVLRTAGYRTLFVGKHHGTDNPYDWGFDHYRGLRDGAANYFNPGLQRDDEPMPAQKRYGKRVFAFDSLVVEGYTPPRDYYATTAWTDWAIELLDKYRNEDKPFLLYLAYQAPHDPLQAPEEAIQKYAGVYGEGYEEIARHRYQRQLEMNLLDENYPRSEPIYPDWESLSDSVRQDEIRRMQVYAAMIEVLDQNIGRLVDYIKSTGEWDNTLFMFLSDNGASAEVVEIGDGEVGAIDRWSSLKGNWANVANTPFRFYKNDPYQGGIATPFIASWPNLIAGGQVNHEPLHFIDIMPTLVEISGAKYPVEYKGDRVHPMQGKSIFPLFKGEDIQRSQPLFFQWRDGRAVRTSDWKLVGYEKDWELYDMKSDRTEMNNVADEKPEVVADLEQQWEHWADTWE